MKRSTVFVFAAVIVLFLSSCVTTCLNNGPVSEVHERKMGVIRKEGGKKTIEELTCPSPGPVVMVGDVVCRAAKCSGKVPRDSGLFKLLQLAGVPDFSGIGDSLGDMFITALRDTGCFRVVDRKELDQIKKELELAGKKFKGPAADYVITGAITSIDYSKKSGTLGGISLPIVGGISTTREKAHLAMDVRVISVETGEVVFSKTYTADSGKTNFGLAGGGPLGDVGFGGTFSSLSGTAMEEVARDIIVRATYDIARKLVPDRVQVRTVPVE